MSSWLSHNLLFVLLVVSCLRQPVVVLYIRVQATEKCDDAGHGFSSPAHSRAVACASSWHSRRVGRVAMYMRFSRSVKGGGESLMVHHRLAL